MEKYVLLRLLKIEGLEGLPHYVRTWFNPLHSKTVPHPGADGVHGRMDKFDVSLNPQVIPRSNFCSSTCLKTSIMVAEA